MLHLLLTFVVFVAVMGMAAVLFSGWIVVSIVRGLGRLLGGTAAVHSVDAQGFRACQNPQCRDANPLPSRFCRRCGRVLQPVGVESSLPVPRRPVHAVQ